jgi:hypothetical protein
MGNESSAYLDPQLAARTNPHTSRQEVLAYFFMTIRHYRDMEMLVVLFNMGNPINFYQVQPSLVLSLFKANRSNNWRSTYPRLD